MKSMIVIAQFGMLILLSLMLILHFVIMLKIVPYKIVWGGRLKSDKEMYRFEILSIVLTVLFITVILAAANFAAIEIPKKIITYALWIMAGLFCLNTIGNTVSGNGIERRLFAPVSLLLAIFSFTLALSN